MCIAPNDNWGYKKRERFNPFGVELMAQPRGLFNPWPGLSGCVLYYPAFHTGRYIFYPCRINQVMSSFYDPIIIVCQEDWGEAHSLNGELCVFLDEQ